MEMLKGCVGKKVFSFVVFLKTGGEDVVFYVADLVFGD